MNAPTPTARLAPTAPGPAGPGATPEPLLALRLTHSFAQLGPEFHTRLAPVPLPDPYLVAVSPDAAALIGVAPAALASPASVAILAGNRPLPGGDPLASVYSGHQFGAWAGQLGDGRALLLGEAVGPEGRCWELQLKGSGRTPYSRMGDGRAVLRSSIREFLCSEAMHALGIPTTRALALVGADAPVVRESVETAAVLTRMAPSFVRFGHFEHFSATGRHDALRRLADYVVARFYPELADAPHPHAALLREVAARTARLIAQWQSVGFCHGVMNTDNMSILGLTIDYGPFGFLDGFDAGHVCNHSDTAGRYAFAMQPGIGEWNCYALGQAMLPLLDSVEQAQDALAVYRPEFSAAHARLLRTKLGLRAPRDGDDALLRALFELLQAGRVDFTLFFRRLADVRSADPGGDAGCRDLFVDRAAFDAWVTDYRARLRGEARDDAERRNAMQAANPKFVLRNHLAETAIRAARGSDELARLSAAPRPGARPGGGDDGRDFSEVQRLLEVLRAPFDEQPGREAYAQLPPDWASGIEVSCSS